MSKEKRRKLETGVGSGVRCLPPVPLPFGWASAVFSDGRLVSVAWESTRRRLTAALAENHPGVKQYSGSFPGAESFFDRYARGEIVSAREVAALPVAWDTVCGFLRDVLRETARIPYGRTFTYGELAARIGHPAAARAVGASLARNPWPVIVPCHRVIGAGGRLVGFGKGLDAKKILLDFEKANARKRNA